jgi:hypothetical protein
MNTSKENDEIVIIASFFCKRCNGNKQQFIKGVKDVWQRVKSISIGPPRLLFIRSSSVEELFCYLICFILRSAFLYPAYFWLLESEEY